MKNNLHNPYNAIDLTESSLHTPFGKLETIILGKNDYGREYLKCIMIPEVCISFKG